MPPSDDELFEQWRARHDREGVRVAVLELYGLVAEARGVAPEALPLEERKSLAARALQVIWPGFEKVARPRDVGPVSLVEHRDEWDERYEAWREALARALGPTARRIEHIGSTAVPGLAAKPIVDIQVSVPEVDDEASYVPGCESVGLELFSRDDVHRFFVNASMPSLDTHVHVCDDGGGFAREHLLFRDYLRGHDEERDAYAAMKRAAAIRWHDDRQGYTYAKNECICDMLERAEAWAAATGWSLE